ncbi:hypothetical protein EJ05DRAFT_484790 [Pseudovirgaria hyperparasitica]|uniref:Uncharacterized protein n=1 Tax=Pseudovirgaria hyperparasitica TaxID=470096 RepID=A0A6A6WE87_9PEZI|nr:uncharacterized protein EJ05DRAFT_484790 [Pseudovirgaria hyperparasitica]KAF2759897.1 hypothetical protein EJ05DRAFT_484790 [Pseudovirgaria hyperparasitica]
MKRFQHYPRALPPKRPRLNGCLHPFKGSIQDCVEPALEDSPKDIFRFMDLPAELRIRVYEELFGPFPEPIFVIKWGRSPHNVRKYVNGVCLLATCRMINTEATPILYKNTIGVDAYVFDIQHLSGFKSRSLNYITSLKVYGDLFCFKRTVVPLFPFQELGSLKKVVVAVAPHKLYNDSGPQIQEMMVRAVRRLLQSLPRNIDLSFELVENVQSSQVAECVLDLAPWNEEIKLVKAELEGS